MSTFTPSSGIGTMLTSHASPTLEQISFKSQKPVLQPVFYFVAEAGLPA
ncbi:MAG: hypothetical protein IPL42_03410 [Saprospiraceae bacterium]|nr:hypothetical protein [Saprospiraceae bacterium]